MNNIIELPSKNKIVQKAKTEAIQVVQQARGLTDFIDFKHVYKYETRKQLYVAIMQSISSWRISVYKKMAIDKDFSHWVQYFSKQDIVAWINLFGWTYDPIRTTAKVTPFVCYKYHRAYLEACQKHPFTIIIKPRGTGYTWVKVFQKIFRFLNDESYQCSIVSRVFDDIDVSGDRHQTIMGRIRFALSKLPFFNLSDLDEDKEGFIQYGDNSIRGYTSNPDALRSGRATELDIEEAGAIQNFTAVMASAVSVSDEIRIGGTVKGASSGFYDFWQNRDSRYHHIFWQHSEHPLFSTKDWEDLERAKYNNDDRLFRQEVLGDFWAMAGEAVLHKLDKYLHCQDLSRIPKHRMVKGVSIDPAAGSSMSAVWLFYYDPFLEKFYFTDYFELARCTYKDVVVEIEKRGFGKNTNTTYLMDSAGKNRTPEGNSWYNLLTGEGLSPLYLVNNKNITGSILVANQNLEDGKIAFESNSKDVENGLSRLTRYVFGNQYGASRVKKDENSDCGDAFRYAMAFPYTLPIGGKGQIIKQSERLIRQKSYLKYGVIREEDLESYNKNIQLFARG